jgi:hypothetical protein
VYCSKIIFSGVKIEIEMGGKCRTYYIREECTRFWCGILRERSLGRTRRRREDIIKMDIQEMGCRGMVWIELAQDKDKWRVLLKEVSK